MNNTIRALRFVGLELLDMGGKFLIFLFLTISVAGTGIHLSGMFGERILSGKWGLISAADGWSQTAINWEWAFFSYGCLFWTTTITLLIIHSVRKEKELLDRGLQLDCDWI